MSKIRIHLSQIWFNPAYYDSEFDLLEEPAPNINIGTGSSLLGKLRTTESIKNLLAELRSSYISHITGKLRNIALWSGARKADIIVLPEYSVPIECLSDLREISKEKGLIIIAGTHRVRLVQNSRKIYGELGIDLSKITNGSAIAPVLLPNGNVLFAPKRAKSKWEPNLNVAGDETPTFKVDLNGKSVSFVVTPCIDSLQLDSFDFFNKEHDGPNMVLSPSLSPEIQMFEDIGKVLSSNEKFFGVVNSATYGGTSFNIPEGWLPFLSGVKPIYPKLPNAFEAIFEIDIDSDSYYMKKGSVHASAPCSHPKIFPIIYYNDNDWIGEFENIKKDTLEMLSSGSPEEAIEWIDEALSSQEIALPESIISLLKDCRHRYLTLYAGDLNAVEDSLTLVVIPKDIVDTRDLFAKRVHESINILTDTFRDLPEEPSETLLNTMKALKSIQIKIGPPKPEKERGKATEENLKERISEHSYLPSDATIASFQDRGDVLDELRGIIVTGSERVIVLTGMPGIGKTELINTLFLKVLTDWKPIWINVSVNTSVARTISEIGSVVGISMDVDSLGSATDEIFRKQVHKVVSTLFSTEKNAFIIDDLKNLIMDHKNYSHLQMFLEVLTAIEKFKGSRVFLLSSVSSAPLWMQRAHIARLPIKRLEEMYIRRVIEYQLRQAKLVPGEEAADIPQALLDGINGHPLAAKIAAIACTKGESKDLSDDIVLSEVSTNIISICLPKIELSADEAKTVNSISIFRQPVDAKYVLEPMELTGQILDNLASKAIVEFDGHTFSMHPLIRKYYYNEIPVDEKKNYHKKAANYYAKVSKRNYLGHFDNPNSAFELVYHLAMAGDFRELFDLRMIIYEEMYPAARTLYSQKQYDKAIELFYKLAEIRPQESAVWAYIGRCHARRSQWKDCDAAFKKAIEVAEARKQPTSWIHRDWGHIRARFGFFDEAIPHIQIAEKLDKGVDPSSISCEAFIQWKNRNVPDATRLFEDALRINPKHRYSLNTYIKMLEETGGRESYIKELKGRLSAVLEEMAEPDVFGLEQETDSEI